MKLLAVGDLHLGRIPTRIPRALDPTGSGAGFGSTPLSPQAAWSAAVGRAIDERVDAVVLAGDVIDGDNEFFESRHALAVGVERLRGAEIPAFAVAGNHDARVLPRVVDEVEGLELIGRGGRWELREVRRAGDIVGHILGWSFPASHHREDPTSALPAAIPRDQPVVGLVHGDLDQPASPYAPLSRSRLESAGTVGWLLGHVHVPSDWGDATRIGYLGTACALDPGETGPRSIWIVESSGADLSMTPVPVSPTRYDELVIDAEPTDDGKSLADRIVERAESLARALPSSVRAYVVRAVVTGQVDQPNDATADLDRFREAEREMARRVGDVNIVLDDLKCSLAPRLDLDELARGDDPIGIAASWLQTIRELRRRGDAVDAGASRPAWYREAREIAARHDHREFAVDAFDDHSGERFAVDVDEDLDRVLTEIVSALDAQRRARDVREGAP